MNANWGAMTGAEHWILMATAIGLVLYPVGRILSRLGFSPIWSLVALFPLVNLAALWILAFAAWPGRARES